MTTPSYHSLLRAYIDSNDSLAKWIIALQMGNILSSNTQTISDEDRRTIQHIYDKERQTVIRPRERPQEPQQSAGDVLEQPALSSTGETLRNVCYDPSSAVEKPAAEVSIARRDGRDRETTTRSASAKVGEGFTPLESPR